MNPLLRILPWLLALAAPAGLALAEDTYLVEVLVFRHVGPEAEALEVEEVRGFHELYQALAEGIPEVPLARPTGSSFRNLWNRLQRLDAYQPLTLMAFEQTRIDYHPPVRLHNDEVIAEELHLPGQIVYVDLRSDDLFAPYVLPLYRLDGSIQLRRSRFLHLHLDLEFRVDDPRWSDAALAGTQAIAGLEMLGSSPAEPQAPNADSGSIFEAVRAVEQETPQPFRIHRLVQSRQVRTDTMHYFDTPFLGVLARVTAIEDTP